MRRGIIITLGLFFLVNFRVGEGQSQREVCPALVQDALARVEQLCSGTGRNQICYGHSAMTAEFRPEITDVLLSTPGDIADIQNITHFQLMAMDLDLEQWGVAVMRVQANLPNTLPGQNALFLLFGDVELTPEPALQLVSSGLEARPEAMNAFRLRTGVGDPECDAAPLDGLLIQTPHGVGRVELTINGVDLSLGSTIFIQAQPGGFMKVYTLEGSVLVTTEDGESLALAGTQVRIPMDDDLQAGVPPLLPQRYNLRTLASLPLEILDRPVEVHEPLSFEEIRAIRQVILSGETQTLLDAVTMMEQPEPVCADGACLQQPTSPPDSATENSTEIAVPTSTPPTPILPTESLQPTLAQPTIPPTDPPLATEPPPTAVPPQPTNPPAVTDSAPQPTVEPASTAV